MKKKLILGITAASLVLTLAVAGTLMLFSDVSNTANNTVTLGKVKIELQEIKLGETTYTTIDDTFKGVDFPDNIVPGDTLQKHAKVKNTGNVPVYVAVKAELSITVPTGEDAIDLTTYFKAGTKNSDALAQILEDLLPLKGEWYGASDYTITKDAIIGTFYYVSQDQSSLAVLAKDGALTADIFPTNGITLPKEFTAASEFDNSFEGYGLSLKLTAYAVQSDNNAPETQNEAGWAAVFSSVFPK
ncbi:MAG: M73 family metallopeptidase [Oscillospiraceae bacterium]|jgi:predicted ribosomally synthesized peptide with SipW-like signal peptide|nr:M73 family metallopeptidase [Oscillospiraceae bacterium]